MEENENSSTMVTPFGETLKKTRKAAGVTMWALSNTIGCNINDIEHIERGLREPTQKEITILERFFGKKIFDFFEFNCGC